jgi:hypothetical protein
MILREEFGAELSNVAVFEIGTSLVGLFDQLSEMDRKDKEQEELKEPKKNEHEETELHKTV